MIIYIGSPKLCKYKQVPIYMRKSVMDWLRCARFQTKPKWLPPWNVQYWMVNGQLYSNVSLTFLEGS